MTDRLNAFIVVLEHEIREDDAEPILNAIRQIRGVLTVTGQVANGSHYSAKEQVKWELRSKIWEALK